MLTQERADVLSKILTDDQDRAKNLLRLEPNDALAQVNALGYDFTLDEIIEYGDAVKRVVAQDELSDEALESVAGGVAFLAIIPAVALAYAIGKDTGIAGW